MNIIDNKCFTLEIISYTDYKLRRWYQEYFIVSAFYVSTWGVCIHLYHMCTITVKLLPSNNSLLVQWSYTDSLQVKLHQTNLSLHCQGGKRSFNRTANWANILQHVTCSTCAKQAWQRRLGALIDTISLIPSRLRGKIQKISF